MFYTYVLESSKDNKWYTGFSGNLKQRLEQHNNNEVCSTKTRGPFKLIYYESCICEYDAIKREKFLKSGPGKRYLKNRLKLYLNTGLPR